MSDLQISLALESRDAIKTKMYTALVDNIGDAPTSACVVPFVWTIKNGATSPDGAKPPLRQIDEPVRDEVARLVDVAGLARAMSVRWW
jgi:hypothetical protein